MAEPKKKLSRARSGARKSHDALKNTSLVVCEKCKSSKLPHTVCGTCGYYRGKKIVKVEREVEIEKKQKEQLKDE